MPSAGCASIAEISGRWRAGSSSDRRLAARHSHAGDSVLVQHGKVGSGRSPDVDQLTDKRSIPWGTLLKTPAIWAIIINHCCSNWSLYVLLAWLPSYFNTTYHVSLADAGLLAAAPWATYFVMGNVGGAWADSMIKRGRSVTFVRKFMQMTSMIGVGGFLLCLPLAGSATVAMLIVCAASGTLALCLSGFAPNSFDVAPRYADVVWGMSNTLGTVPGIVGVSITGWLIDRTGNYNAPFLLTAIVGIVGAAVYMVIGSGETKVA